MAAKTISLSIPAGIAVGKVDVEFKVRNGTRLLGTLQISQGGLDWLPAHARRSKPRRATWEQFNEWMQSGS